MRVAVAGVLHKARKEREALRATVASLEAALCVTRESEATKVDAAEVQLKNAEALVAAMGETLKRAKASLARMFASRGAPKPPACERDVSAERAAVKDVRLAATRAKEHIIAHLETLASAMHATKEEAWKLAVRVNTAEARCGKLGRALNVRDMRATAARESWDTTAALAARAA